jgi:hypothetical protein
MLDALYGAGRKVLLLNVPPSTSYNTTAKRTVLAQYNAWVRDRPITRRGIVVVDAWRQLANPATGEPGTNMANDTVHYSEHGAHRLGPRGRPRPRPADARASTAHRQPA